MVTQYHAGIQDVHTFGVGAAQFGGKQTDVIVLLIAAWIVITHILLDNLIAGAKLAKL